MTRAPSNALSPSQSRLKPFVIFWIGIVGCMWSWNLNNLHSRRSLPIPSTMLSRFPFAVVVSLPTLCLLAQPAISTQLFNHDVPTSSSTTCETITGDIEHTIIHGCVYVCCHLPSLSRLLMDVGYRVIPDRTTRHTRTTSEADANPLPTAPLLPSVPGHTHLSHGTVRSISAPTPLPTTDQQSTSSLSVSSAQSSGSHPQISESSASGVDGSSSQSNDSRSVRYYPDTKLFVGRNAD
jgi:hypothetical protein